MEKRIMILVIYFELENVAKQTPIIVSVINPMYE